MAPFNVTMFLVLAQECNQVEVMVTELAKLFDSRKLEVESLWHT